MKAFVYRSGRNADTYLYLRERDAFACLPPALAQRMGPLVFVLELELAPTRKLAREDPRVVRANLEAHGYHVQLPPPPDGSLRR